MRFADSALHTIVETWRLARDENGRAEADNLWFEERVTTARQAHFEAAVHGAVVVRDVQRRHRDYWRDHVRVDNPATFDSAFAPVPLSARPLDTAQRIVRLERIEQEVLARAGLSVTALREAVDSRNESQIDRFVAIWNGWRDERPLFAAWKDEVLAELRAPDWAVQLRNRMGLAHYDPDPGPIPVLLMEYQVADVLSAASARGVATAFVAPTVLDSGPWPWFFPSPVGLHYGRTVALRPSASTLLTEVLHPKMDYTPNHIMRVGEIADRLDPAPSVRERRNAHLAHLRAVATRPDFGEEM